MIDRDKLLAWENRINALEMRERLLLLLTVIVLTYGVIDLLLLSPLQLGIKQSEQSFIDWQNKLVIIEQQARDFASNQDPLASQRQKLSQLQAEIAEQQLRLEAEMGNLLSNEEAPQLLYELIDAQKNLQLISLNSRHNDPIAKTTDEGLAVGFNRYHLELTLNGSYLDALRFVKSMESSDWQLFWDSLKLEIVEHPIASIKIQLYTLGAGA